MKPARKIGVLLASVLLALAGMTAFASVAQAKAWEPYTTNSNWHCGLAEGHVSNSQMVFYSCVVYSAGGGSARSALIAENHWPSALPITYGETYISQGGLQRGHQVCDASLLSSGYSRACFGDWVPICTGVTFRAVGELVVSGYADTALSPLRPAC